MAEGMRLSNWERLPSVYKNGADFCEHTENNKEAMHGYAYETDSFGPVSVYVCCKECYEECKKEVNEVEHTCSDCKAVKELQHGIMWKWYDFDERQGDVPTFICNDCKPLEKHKRRVAIDDMNYRQEFGWDDDCDD